MNNKPVLNIIVVDTHDIYTLGLADTSSYPQGYAIINPTIEITPPSFDRITLGMSSKNFSIYDAASLGLLCSSVGRTPLPDGVWKLRFSIYPSNEYNVEKTFLRTYKIESKLGQAFLNTDLDKRCLEDKMILDDAWALIQGAIADAAKCNEMAAMKKYNEADKILNHYNKLK